MSAIATTTRWAPNPALADPDQALWSELRFAAAPVDLFTLLIGAIRHCEGAHPKRGQTFRYLERTIVRWVAAGMVAATGTPALYSLERTYLNMASPPAFPNTLRRNPFPKRTQHQRLWSAMRILKHFDLPTLTMTARANEQAARQMLGVLQRGGWLRRTATGWSTAAARPWGSVAPTISRIAAAEGAIIRITDHLDGTVIELPVRRQRSRDAASAGRATSTTSGSSTAAALDGGVS
jgi:hypothetical protein